MKQRDAAVELCRDGWTARRREVHSAESLVRLGSRRMRPGGE
jgi:hypothetical protein